MRDWEPGERSAWYVAISSAAVSGIAASFSDRFDTVFFGLFSLYWFMLTVKRGK